jgi:hypothetical protein
VKHTVIQKYFFLEILINVKATRVKEGARKVYHGRRVGQACSKVCDSFDQAAHYHFLGIYVGGASSDLALGWLQGKEVRFYT